MGTVEDGWLEWMALRCPVVLSDSLHGLVGKFPPTAGLGAEYRTNVDQSKQRSPTFHVRY